MAKKTKDDIKQEVDALQNKLDVLTQQSNLSKTSCRICGKPGCDILSLLHRGPVHHTCLKSQRSKP